LLIFSCSCTYPGGAQIAMHLAGQFFDDLIPLAFSCLVHGQDSVENTENAWPVTGFH